MTSTEWRYHAFCVCIRCTQHRESQWLNTSLARRVRALQTAQAMPAPAKLYKPAHGGRNGS